MDAQKQGDIFVQINKDRFINRFINYYLLDLLINRLLTLNRFTNYSSVSIVRLEQVNASWRCNITHFKINLPN